MVDDCLFCQIAHSGCDVHEVYRDDLIVAFLDHEPIRAGHTQIIPIAQFESFDELPPNDAATILHFGQRLAVIQKRLFNVPRVGFLFTGGDVPHAHAHVVPLAEKTDITSRAYIDAEKVTFRPAQRADTSALAEVAERLRTGLSSPSG